jgi:hypothetical protein
MASTLNALFGALVAAAFWTCLGVAIARRIMPAALAWPVAPTLGWAVHSAATLPILTLLGFSTVTAAIAAAVALTASIVALARSGDSQSVSLPLWIWGGAAVLAMGVAVAILPKTYGDSVILAPAIFDHSKLAMIDEMTRHGLPPGNPFFHEVGGPERLVYYYLFYYSAAGLSLLTGISGWEADVALTWFAAFSALLLMMGLAAWFAGRPLAALWVLPLAVSASLRPLLFMLFERERVDAVLLGATGFAGWQSQAAWVPQHLMSATCVMVAVLLLGQLAKRQSVLLVATFVLVVVAGFESSTWVGGVGFAVAALAVGVVLLIRAQPRERLPFVAGAAVAGVLAICLAAPFLYDQFAATAMRASGFPMALRPYYVLGDWFPAQLRRVLDLPAFWLVFLVVEFPAVYLTGAFMLCKLAGSKELEPERKQVAVTLAALCAASLTVSWLLVSTIANNDLGWRVVLPGAMVLTVFAAVGLYRWLATRAVIPVAVALALLALGLPEGVGYLRENIVGKPAKSGRAFAKAPALWEAVRRHLAPGERVGNDPHFLGDLTLWDVNISWSLLSNRRSCFASEPLVLAYTSLPDARRHEIYWQFNNVFAGEGSAEDIREFATRYNCHLIVMTAQDKAWAHDPFTASPFYSLVDEKPGEWRIYRRKTAQGTGAAAK